MKRYIVVSGGPCAGDPPNVDGFFDSLKDVPSAAGNTAIEIATGRVFEIEWTCQEWREVDRVEVE